MIDLRQSYQNSLSHSFIDEDTSTDTDTAILPQVNMVQPCYHNYSTRHLVEEELQEERAKSVLLWFSTTNVKHKTKATGYTQLLFCTQLIFIPTMDTTLLLAAWMVTCGFLVWMLLYFFLNYRSTIYSALLP